jgi:uncharacterized cupredoxin-like copper-binding protein
MNLTRRSILIVAATAPALAAIPAYAATTIDVSLRDNPDMAMAQGLGHGMGGMMSMANMTVAVSQSEFPAGTVTFSATNDSQGLVHEMIVARLTTPGEALPYDPDNMRVDEEAAGSLGEVSELEPGQKGALTITLKPGKYILFCNIPCHYMAGMWRVVTAT